MTSRGLSEQDPGYARDDLSVWSSEAGACPRSAVVSSQRLQPPVKDQGQLAPDLDLDLAFEVLSGPLYYRLLITQQPLIPDYINRVPHVLFAGLSPRPQPR
ncbi:TetR-like C-terminal domain-containing protein [Nonomuraea sp. NPDC003709]|uniref:TetR-like C-terminal domain-containing protein n=1 Tax=Nonomuraea sp. NPDC003709 TaxID=3154450 RepID=UPI0033A8FE1E